jgi:N6-adenosine-specific RNA methylase IME4
MSAPIKPTTRTRQQWAQRLNKVWGELTQTIVEGYFQLGRDLLHAKEELPHGEFIKMVNEDLEMDRHVANMFMRITRSEMVGNAHHLLPADYTTINKLTRLPAEIFQRLVEDGTICPQLLRKDVNRIIRAVRKEEYQARVGAAKPRPLEGTYRILLADCPWRYSNNELDDYVDNYGHCDRHYTPMTIEELCDYRPDGVRPVREMVDKNAVLFMWVTAPMVGKCAPVYETWGFEYKEQIVWDKVRHMVGHYVSVQHELLYICTRGSCTRDTPKLLPSVVRIPKSSVHSQKPEKFREMIEEMYTYGRKLELFARGRRREGWDAVGNELEEDACPGFEQLSPFSHSRPVLALRPQNRRGELMNLCIKSSDQTGWAVARCYAGITPRSPEFAR